MGLSRSFGSFFSLKPPPVLDGVLNYYNSDQNNTKEEIDGVWVVAMPLDLSSWEERLTKLWHGWLVATGRAKAVQYARQRKKLLGHL